ncbi:MAG: cation:proton antiporter [Polyangiaceae bacterium]|nr:cation:proton antiporter [Polyangiaceae bacterium]
MSKHGDLPALLLLLGISVIGPVAAFRLHLPTAVVLILAGLALGPAGMGLLHDSPTISFVSEFGFLVLMFMAGMEIDFDAIRTAGRAALAAPALVVAGILAGAVVLGRLAGLGGVEILVISAMSVGMPLAVLKETGRAATPLGQHVMLTVSLGEFACILAITGLEVVSSSSFGPRMVGEVAQVALLFVASGLLIRWARALVWWYPKAFRRLIEHHDVAELGVRVGLVVMLGFVAMAALAGVEPILGAFLGGALVGFVLRQKQVLESKIAALGNGLFIPIFFVVVGVRFRAGELDVAAVRTALFLALLASLAKILPSLLFARRRTPLRDRLAAGCLLSAPLTLVVAIGTIGHDLGFIDARRQASIVLVAMLVSIVFPTMFRAIVGGADPVK